jgi:hypothetical protein
MAQTKQFNIKINGTNQLVELNDLLQTNVRSLGDLKEQQDLLQQAFDQADYGTAAFDELQSSLRDVNTQIKVIDESVSDLTIGEKFEGVSRIVGAVGGAFAFASVSVQAFGEENSKTAQELQKLETQISAVIQGQQALTGIIDAFGSKNKVVAATINGLNRAFNAMGISAKGAGLAVRGALIATGIGILVVAVSTLIANFDEIKAAGAGIFKAWQPFFDGVRNFASALTFGLIDSSVVSNNRKQLDLITNDIEKSQKESQSKLDKISKESANTTAEKIQQTIQQLSVYTDQYSKNVENAVKIRNSFFASTAAELRKNQKTIDDINKLTPDPNKRTFAQNITFQEAFVNVAALKDQQDVIEKITNKIVQKNIVDQDTIDIADSKLFYSKNQNETDKIYLQNADLILLQVKEGLKLKENEIDTNIKLTEQRKQEQIEIINNLLKIQSLQNQIAKEKVNQDSLVNNGLKQGIDLIIQYGNALQDPKFSRNFPVFDKFNEELNKIEDRFPEFKDKFDDILINNTSNESIVNIKKVQDLILEFRNKEKERILENIALDEKALRNQIDANNKLIKQEPVRTNELTLQNDLLEAQIKTIGLNGVKAVRELTDETKKLSDSLPDLLSKLKLDKVQNEFERAIRSFDDFKNGLKLTTEQADELNKVLGIDTSTAFKDLSINQKEFLQNQVDNKTLDFYKEFNLQLAELAKDFPQLTELLDQYNKKIEEQNRILETNNNLSKERQKGLQEELALLIKAEEIRNLQNTAADTNAPYKVRVDAINKLNALELKNIDDKFKAETKGLKETDAAYQIAIINRNKAQEEQGKNTIKSLQDVQRKFELVATTTINGIGQLTDSVFQFIQAGISKQQEVLNEQLTDLNNQVTTIQEQIGIIDEVINSKKQTIADLEEKAKNATGGNRDEILNKLSKEFDLTQKLIKQKQEQQKQEKNLQNDIRKNQLEQNKLQKESNQLQKQGAVIASILATAQAAVAVATLAKTSSMSDFTFGVLTVAGVISLGAALISTFASIRALADGGFVKSKAEGGEVDPYGYTNKLGVSNSTDSTGERPTKQLVQLHSDEYVIPRWQVNKNRSLVSSLEKERVRGMADGGTVNNNNFNNNNNDQLNNLLIANLNKPVYVSVVDINNGQQRVNVIESRSQI